MNPTNPQLSKNADIATIPGPGLKDFFDVFPVMSD